MPHRILIVDDEPDVLDSLRQALTALLALQVEVHVAATGEEAKERLDRENSYDMVITDERMPGLRGVELLEWLRLTHPATVRVLMTAYREPYIGQAAVNRAGAHLFLYKPFDLDSVLPALRRALGDKARRDEQERALERALRIFKKLARESA